MTYGCYQRTLAMEDVLVVIFHQVVCSGANHLQLLVLWQL